MKIDPDVVLDAMAAMDDRDQHLIQLRFWNQLSWEKIAVLMGFASPESAENYWENTVAVALRAALKVSE